MTTLLSRAPRASRAARPPRAVVRWMGNKSAHLGPIGRAVAAVAGSGSLVVDPMAGSQAVGRALAPRHRLVTSDAQAASAVIGRAFIDNVTVERVDDAFVALLAAAAEGRATTGARGFLERRYAGTWFSARQCRALDTLRGAVDDVAPDESDPRRDLALAALMVAACRAQASPGHFAQHLPARHPRTRELRRVRVTDVALGALRGFRVATGRRGGRSFALPWRRLVEERADLLADAEAWYLDPPYTRDQYSRFYHLLETLVLADGPPLGRQCARLREDRFRSDFCVPSRAGSELRDLLAAIRAVSPRAAVVLSYSARGLLSREGLLAAGRPAYRVSSSRALHRAHSTQGKGLLRNVTEWLLVLRP